MCLYGTLLCQHSSIVSSSHCFAWSQHLPGRSVAEEGPWHRGRKLPELSKTIEGKCLILLLIDRSFNVWTTKNKWFHLQLTSFTAWLERRAAPTLPWLAYCPSTLTSKTHIYQYLSWGKYFEHRYMNEPRKISDKNKIKRDRLFLLDFLTLFL